VNGGAIKVLGNSIYISNSTLSTGAEGPEPGSGGAGDILLADPDGASQARTIELVDSRLSSSVTCSFVCDFFKYGDSGTVTLKGLTTTLDGTELSVSNSLLGKGGRIIVNSGEFRMMNGATLTSTTSGLGVGAAPGGDIALTAAGLIDIRTGSSILASSSGDGNAGSITITAGQDIQIRQSNITTSTTGDISSGGNIKLTAPNLVRIVDSTITSSVQGQTGSNGGNIDIDPQVVVIQNSALTANANAGAGGNINIAALGAVLVDPNSLLSATAGPAGVSGSVNISSPIQVLSGALVPMKLAYTQTGLSGDRCAADPKGQFSSFVQTGRDGAPQSPGGLASSPLGFLDALQTSFLNTDQSITQTARLGLSDHTDAVRVFTACRS
jgi:hypothetical protein